MTFINRRRNQRMQGTAPCGFLFTVIALVVTGLLMPTNSVSAATTVLDEDWQGCTSTFGEYVSYGGAFDGGVGTIGISAYSELSGTLTCPNWTFSGQAWLSRIISNTSATPTSPAVGSKAMYLNEGNGTSTLGKASRTLTGLTPGGFYELIVFAWKDASAGSTKLGLEVVSGTATTTYSIDFDDANAGPQTVRLRFPVEATSATITLTGGWRAGIDASPILGSVKVESRPTVFFLPNGATGTMASQSEPSLTALRTNTFTLEGCTFLEWRDESGGTYSDGEEYDFSEDLILTAQWSCPNDRPSFDIDIDIENYRDRTTLPDTI